MVLNFPLSINSIKTARATDLEALLKQPEKFAELTPELMTAVVEKVGKGALSSLAKAIEQQGLGKLFSDPKIKALHAAASKIKDLTNLAAIACNDPTHPQYVPTLEAELKIFAGKGTPTKIKLKVLEAILSTKNQKLISLFHNMIAQLQNEPLFIDGVMIPLLKRHNYDPEQVLKILNPKNKHRKTTIVRIAEALKQCDKKEEGKIFAAKYSVVCKARGIPLIRTGGETTRQKGSAPFADHAEAHSNHSARTSLRGAGLNGNGM